MSGGGKGDRPRPFSVDQKTFASNWDAIFGKKKTEEEKFDEQVVMKEEFYDLDGEGPADSEQGG